MWRRTKWMSLSAVQTKRSVVESELTNVPAATAEFLRFDCIIQFYRFYVQLKIKLDVCHQLFCV